MKVTFKDVGQGDSILIEWERGGKEQRLLGIIDCRRVETKNPVLEHLMNEEIREIEFVILSHPHFDHYSGMLELFEYCDVKKIKIRFFGFSGSQGPDYLKAFKRNESDYRGLRAIFRKVRKMRDAGLIEHSGFPNYGWQLKLNANYTMRCLAPSGNETDLFVQQVNFFHDRNDERRARLAANLLSTLFLIESNTHASGIVLTSDSCLETFDRILRNMSDLSGIKLLLCQVPHHGSLENHKIAFWKSLVKDTNCPAVVSAGRHKRYCHPNKHVIKDFNDSEFKVHATNFVNGVEQYFNEKAEKRSSMLNMASEIVEHYDLEGDQVFQLIRNTAVAYRTKKNP
jgi:beta-lactamase superfamily II metal-dependent hydrolase